MTATWLSRLARAIGIGRSARALRHRPAWFDATYRASPDHQETQQTLPTRAYSELERAAVWRKGQPMDGWDTEDWRVDHRGNPIFRHHYGDSDSAFGWQVGRITADGGDDLGNLRPELRPKRMPGAAFERAFDLDRFTQ